MRREDISSSCLNALLSIWQHRCNITELRIGEYAIMGVGYGRAIAELVNLVSKIPTLQVIAVIFPLSAVARAAFRARAMSAGLPDISATR